MPDLDTQSLERCVAACLCRSGVQLYVMPDGTCRAVSILYDTEHKKAAADGGWFVWEPESHLLVSHAVAAEFAEDVIWMNDLDRRCRAALELMHKKTA